jgi:hypothetical protein
MKNKKRIFWLLIVVVLVLLVINIRMDGEKKVSATPQMKQELYHVIAVSHKGVGVMSLSTDKGEVAFLKYLNGSIYTPHFFEVDLDGGILVKFYSAFDEKGFRAELRFDNKEALADFTTILMKYGRDVGACHDGVGHVCTVFLF